MPSMKNAVFLLSSSFPPSRPAGHRETQPPPSPPPRSYQPIRDTISVIPFAPRMSGLNAEHEERSISFLLLLPSLPAGHRETQPPPSPPPRSYQPIRDTISVIPFAPRMSGPNAEHEECSISSLLLPSLPAGHRETQPPPHPPPPPPSPCSYQPIRDTISVFPFAPRMSGLNAKHEERSIFPLLPPSLPAGQSGEGRTHASSKTWFIAISCFEPIPGWKSSL